MKKLSTALLMACTFALGLIAYTPAASADCKLRVYIKNKTGKKLNVSKVRGYRKKGNKSWPKTLGKNFSVDNGKTVKKKGTFDKLGNCKSGGRYQAKVSYTCLGGSPKSKSSSWSNSKGKKHSVTVTIGASDCK